MTPEEQANIDAIERDRRRREEELVILLLMLFGKATRRAGYAILLGHDPVDAARNAIVGSPRLGLNGMGGSLTQILAMTHSDGVRRTDKMMGRAPSIARDEVIQETLPIYRGAAQRMATEMADTLASRITQAVNDATAAGKTPSEVARLIPGELETDGYGPDKPYLLETVSELAIVNAHTAGMVSANTKGIWGFRFVAVLDTRTTVICKTCDGTRLPVGHPWFLTHTPSMHFGCRSCLLPIPNGSKLAVATPAPDIQPADGFGHPWFEGGLAA